LIVDFLDEEEEDKEEEEEEEEEEEDEEVTVEDGADIRFNFPVSLNLI
jgi:hypothetical protein